MGGLPDAVKSKGFMGFGGSAPDIDLDASCIMFDEQGSKSHLCEKNCLNKKKYLNFNGEIL